MVAAKMPRNQRALLAGVGVVALYGFAALLWFTGRAEAWSKAQKNYDKACKALRAENKLIASRAEWEAEAEAANLQMPVAKEGEDTAVRWRRQLDKLAAEHNVTLVDRQDRPAEPQGDVWEMSIDVKYEAPLVKLVEFLYALDTAEGSMFDVRNIDIKPAKNRGYLSGKFTLTCAYMLESNRKASK